MSTGGSDILESFASRRYNQMGGVSIMSIAMDCASGIDPQRRRRIEGEIPGSIFGRMTNLLHPEVCESVAVEDLGDAYRAPIESDVPILMVSGTLDSNTPPWQAEEVRRGLSNSAHVIVQNAGHESTIPVPEVRELIASFLSGEDIGDRTIALPALEFAPIPENVANACEAGEPLGGFDPLGRWAFETSIHGEPVRGMIAIRGDGAVLRASIEADGVPPLEVASVSIDGSCLTVIAHQSDGVQIEFRFRPVESGRAGRWAIAGGGSGEIIARKER